MTFFETASAIIDERRRYPWEPAGDRFPITRRGYDCATVDAHIEELERELTDLRSSSKDAVVDEIQRIGEQTSSILLVAQEKAREITHSAQEQADSCLSDAAANAVAMTEEAKAKLRQLDSETDSVWRERLRLLEDARSVAGAAPGPAP